MQAPIDSDPTYNGVSRTPNLLNKLTHRVKAVSMPNISKPNENRAQASYKPRKWIKTESEIQAELEQSSPPVFTFPEVQGIFLDKPVNRQKLECIALLTTEHEIQTGRFSSFFSRLISTLTHRLDLDFVIFLNKPVDIPEVGMLGPYFNNTFVVSTDISPEEDVRVNHRNNLEYGGCSGPNILFLRSIRYCKKYNTTLCLETDCFLMPGWADACINYVTYSGTFVVAGANYDGPTLSIPPDESDMFHHLNGVAFYNTQSEYFKILINLTEMYIKELAKKQMANAYDVVMTFCVRNELKENRNHAFWNFVYRNMAKTTLILNASLPTDKDTRISDMLFKFPAAVIIHKKD